MNRLEVFLEHEGVESGAEGWACELRRSKLLVRVLLRLAVGKRCLGERREDSSCLMKLKMIHCQIRL